MIQLSQLISLIRNAKKPVLLLGSQSVLPPIPAAELAAAIKVKNCFIIYINGF